VFSKRGAPGVMADLRDRGCGCYGLNRSPDPLPNYIRCEKRGWGLLGPIMQWIVVAYDGDTHSVTVDATRDL
jgi:hypothetical protein